MNEVELKQKVDEIIKESRDYERAHGDEDALHVEIIAEFCPEWVKKEIDRLSAADFARYCA